MKKTLAFLFTIGLAVAARAGGLESLEAFVKSAKSGRAEFAQVVTSPAKEGQVARRKTSTGTFEFSRPNRFRFDYRKPLEQTIVADGHTLWLYDPDLKQVTARDQAKALGSTPAALVAASPDLASLKRDFDLKSLPDQDGLQWVEATPKVRDGQLHSVKVGFRGSELARLDILDSFGQHSVLTFSRMEVNVPIAAKTFSFQPPQGADVIRQ